MKRPFYLLFILMCILIGSCKQEKITYRLFVSTDEPDGEISKAIKKVMENNHNVEIELVNGAGSFANLDSIADGVADIALIENFVPFRDDVRSLLTFYPKVLHLFYLDDGGPEPTSFKELLYDKTVFIGEEGTGAHLFMEDMFEFFKLDRSRIKISDNIFTPDNQVIIGFTDIVRLKDLATLQGFKLYSLDNLENYGKGSIVDAISLRYPQVHPFVIPETSYQEITDKPIVTVASEALLIVRAGLRESFVYDLTSTIFNEKQDFINLSPLIYSGLDEKFDRSQISFPLHEGARVFLDRDEPGFFERYAELVGVLFSIVIAIVSALISLSKWQSQKKKDRVDIFYRELMEMKNANFKTSAEGIEKIKGIQESQNKAFDMLINEELEANESFRIYMELSKETIHEIRGRVKALRNLNK